MTTRVYMDGEIVDSAGATISVFDRGFLYGDSVYEVFRTFGGVPVALEPHLERLAHSALGIALVLPDQQIIRSAVQNTLAAAGNRESYVRVVVTRGSGEVGLDTALADRPRLIVIVKELTLPTEAQYRDGVSVRIVSVVRNSPLAIDPSVKSGNYLNNILALHEARRAGGYEALMCDADGRIAEGSSSNIFVVSGGRLKTPALHIGLLPGITRQRVIELARDIDLHVDECSLQASSVLGAEEAFITSSIRGVLPVTSVNGRPLSQGRPGAVTRQLMGHYERYLQAVARS